MTLRFIGTFHFAGFKPIVETPHFEKLLSMARLSFIFFTLASCIILSACDSNSNRDSDIGSILAQCKLKAFEFDLNGTMAYINLCMRSEGYELSPSENCIKLVDTLKKQLPHNELASNKLYVMLTSQECYNGVNN